MIHVFMGNQDAVKIRRSEPQLLQRRAEMPASMRSRVPPNETYVQFPADPEASGQNIIFTIVYKPLTNEYNENTR